MAKKINKTIKNGFENIVNNIVNKNGYSLRVPPIQNLMGVDYNTREQLYTLMWPNLSYNYSTNAIFRTLVQQPVLDAFKGGYFIESDLLSSEEIEVLEEELEKADIINKIKNLFFWNRLYGGSGLIIEVENQDTNTPWKINYLQKDNKVNFYVANRWELSRSATSNNKIDSAKYDDDLVYYYGLPLNKDRLILLNGIDAPTLIRQILNGWGLSVCEGLIAPSNAYNKAMNLIFELIDEAKLDIYSIEGLKESAATGNDKVVIDQIQLVNMLKNFHNSIVLDTNDKYEQRQLQLTGIVDVIHELKLDIASSVKMPAIILWGMSPSGFSSGEYDLKSYYSNIESELRPAIKHVFLKILRIYCKTLFGVIPNDLNIRFENLIVQSKTEEETAKDREFARLKTMLDSQLLTKKEFFDALKRNNIFIQKTKSSNEDEYIELQDEQDIDKLDL